MLESDAGRDKAELACALLQEADRLPKFALADVVPDDHGHRGLEQIAYYGLEAGVAAFQIGAASAVKQRLDRRGPYEIGRHVGSPLLCERH